MAAKTLTGGHGVAATGGSDAHMVQASVGATRCSGDHAEDLRTSILNLETRAQTERQGLSLAWRYAVNLPRIRRMQSWNWERCKAR